MSTVTVLAVDIVSYNYLGLKTPKLCHYALEHGILTPCSGGIGIVIGILVLKAEENRIVSYPTRPKPCESFILPQAFLVGHVHYLRLESEFAGIIGHHSAEKQMLIVGVCGKNHQVRFLCRRIPRLHVTWQFTERIHRELAKPFRLLKAQNDLRRICIDLQKHTEHRFVVFGSAYGYARVAVLFKCKLFRKCRPLYVNARTLVIAEKYRKRCAFLDRTVGVDILVIDITDLYVVAYADVTQCGYVSGMSIRKHCRKTQ